ncbi:elongation factor 1-gamma-like isoform X4 [Anguilla rostrata]|uniref:elongation factor 1-gamma-like isoform X4 n=1 Tax=Anguilla rostrata TaxID=7938 RepID=UPI0030D09E8C
MATLYTPRDFWRSYPILISAQYSGARITVDPSFPGFKGEDSRETDCFLSDFPLRKVPAFVENGFWIQEASAIANYVASDVLRGSGPQDQALVQQWVNLAEGEIVPSMASWVYPAMGRAAYSEKASEKAKEVLLGLLSVLNQHLLPRTYLVGDAVTLADISVACALLLLFTQAMEPSMRQVYLNVTRWFCTCVHQPQFRTVLGDVVLCETAAVPGKLNVTPASSEEILKAPQQEEVSVKQHQHQQQQEEVPQQAEEQKQQQVEEQEEQKQPLVEEEQKQPLVEEEQKQPPQVEEEQKEQPQVEEEQKEQPQVEEEQKEQPQVEEEQKQQPPQVEEEQKQQPPQVEEDQKEQPPQVEVEQNQEQPQVEVEQKQEQPQLEVEQKQPQVEQRQEQPQVEVEQKQEKPQVEGLDATEEALAAEPKAKDPFASLPKSSFVLDEFKRTYSNEDTLKVALPYLWEKLDPNGWSLWYCEYKYPSELSRVFMSCNLITGMFQRLDRLRKHAFASVALLGADGDSSISGVWLLRGQRLPFELCEDWKADYESYSWRKLDPGSEETRTLVREYLSWQGDFKHVGKTFNQAKIFK